MIPQRLTPDLDTLRQFYVGQDVSAVPRPAVTLDRAKMRRHCESLSRAVADLGVGFRAHIKTHKVIHKSHVKESLLIRVKQTIEGTRIQVGGSKTVNLVVSTIVELEHILPLLQEYISEKRSVNVLYGIPLPVSQVNRLAAAARQLGPGSITVMVDHAAQLAHVTRFLEESGFPAGVYLKVDTGYHRAGLPPQGINKDGLVTKLKALHAEEKLRIVGLYSHSSLSYNDSTPEQAMANLEGEILGCLEVCSQFPEDITVSVGASPQVTSILNLTTESAAATSLKDLIQRVASQRRKLELHAGVYSVLDMQQVSTHSRALGSLEEEIAISVVAEVCSVYNDGERNQPEALLAVGVLGLGREPCPSYKGWGVLNQSGDRMIISRISQEHSIVAWEGDCSKPLPLQVGQVVQIFPNHACITGALYGWYLVVDSEASSTKVVDVWIRASGW